MPMLRPATDILILGLSVVVGKVYQREDEMTKTTHVAG